MDYAAAPPTCAQNSWPETPKGKQNYGSIIRSRRRKAGRTPFRRGRCHRTSGVHLRLAANSAELLQSKKCCPQNGAFLVELHDFEAFPPLGYDIHASIRMFLGYRNDLGCTSNFSNALLLGANHAKRFFLLQTFRDHFFVTRLKNVQR